MKLVLLISISCVLNSDLVSSELYHEETQLINAPGRTLHKRQDKLFTGMSSGYMYNRHQPKMMHTTSLAKKLINSMNQGTRMIRQVHKRPKMLLVTKAKIPITLRVIPGAATANHHRFQMKFQKKPIQMPVKEEVHETHHHTFSEEHIHIDEEDETEPEVKIYADSGKQNKGHTNDYLKEIEMREERKIEAAMGHQLSNFSPEIVHGKPYDFEDDWKPIEKPKPASKLNTFVMDQPIAKQVHHHTHIIELDFENKHQPASEIKPQPPPKHNIKPAAYSIINFHPSNPKKEETSKESGLLLNKAAINADYFYNKKFKDTDYLQADPSNRIQTTLKRINELTTQIPFITTTQRHRASPNYSFRIKPIEMTTASTPTEAGTIEIRRPPVITERKKHKNLVAQTLNRGAIKFDKSESN